MIPGDVDVLVTHGPPIGHGDRCMGGNRAGTVVDIKDLYETHARRGLGCVDLLREIQTRVKPKYHVFGHIHEGYGLTTDGTTVFANASICNYHYRGVNAPVVFDLPTKP
jgi:Icc-related predicted phosphoesterase